MLTQFSLRSIMCAFCIAKCSNSCLALQKYIFTYILVNIFAVQKCSTKCLQIHFCVHFACKMFQNVYKRIFAQSPIRVCSLHSKLQHLLRSLFYLSLFTKIFFYFIKNTTSKTAGDLFLFRKKKELPIL